MRMGGSRRIDGLHSHWVCEGIEGRRDPTGISLGVTPFLGQNKIGSRPVYHGDPIWTFQRRNRFQMALPDNLRL